MAFLERINIRDDISDPTFTDDNRLVFRVSFNVDVNNVNAADFIVTGTSGATIELVESVNNNNAQYDIVVQRAALSSFNGEIGIALAPTQDIVDASDNSPVPTAPPTGRNDFYTIGDGNQGGDTTPPTLLSIERQDPLDATTDADGLGFRVTFDEPVLNVNVADFVVNGGTTATVTGFVQISETVYDILVTGGDLANFNGPVGLDLAAGQNITDAAGNALPAGDPAIDEVYTVANDTVPELVSIERLTPAAETTNSDTLVFQVTFSEDVQNIDAADFVVNGGTTALVTDVVSVNNDDSVYNVTVSGGDLADFNGPVNLALATNQDITNLANVAVPVAAPTGANEAYTVTNDPEDPALISIERLTPGAETTSEDTLVFQATFDEGVQNVDAADFSINGDTTATITDVTAVSDSVYNITVAGGDLADFNGSVGIDLAVAQDITDLVGNALPGGEPAIDESYTVSNTVTSDSSLNPLGNILEISQFVSFQSLSLETLVSNITSVGDVNIYQTDSTGTSRTLIAEFSVLEADVLGDDYTPRYTLIGDDFDLDFDDGSDDSNFIQIEVVEKGVTSIGQFTATSETEVTLEFEDSSKLNVSLTDDTLDDDLLNDDASLIDLTGLTGTSEVTFTVYREAALTNTVGFYATDTADGGIIDPVTGNTLQPGDAGYKDAALAKQLTNVQLTGQENGQATDFSATITNGGYLGIFVVIDGADPAVDEVFFGYQGMNSDGFDHMRKVGANAFGIEDILGGGDRDFNDLVVEFEITSVTA